MCWVFGASGKVEDLKWTSLYALSEKNGMNPCENDMFVLRGSDHGDVAVCSNRLYRNWVH